MTDDRPIISLNLPEPDYHARPELSHSLAKMLLPPSCPAIMRWQQANPKDSRVFEFGRAAHLEALGHGWPTARLEFDDRRTKAYKDAEAEARANGLTPLLAKDHDRVLDMAKALRDDQLAGSYFDHDGGDPEVSLFWTDPDTDVALRARLDWLPHRVDGRRLVVADYKTAESADPWTFARNAAKYGYHSQAPWYQDAVEATVGDRPLFVFIVQAKEPPYPVAVVQLDEESLDLGRRRNAEARAIYADCFAHDSWPGYTTTEPALVTLPAWAFREEL
jgi:hypothetical protein